MSSRDSPSMVRVSFTSLSESITSLARLGERMVTGLDVSMAAQGDKILFFTDGAIEAKNEEGNEFGLERLRETFSKSRDLTFVDEIITSYNWQAMADDLTLALLEYEKKEEI